MILPLFKCITCLVKVSAKLSNYFLIFLISFKRWRYFLKMSHRARASPSVFLLCCDHSDQFVLGPLWPICPLQLWLKTKLKLKRVRTGTFCRKEYFKGNISTKTLKIMMPLLSMTINSADELSYSQSNPSSLSKAGIVKGHQRSLESANFPPQHQHHQDHLHQLFQSSNIHFASIAKLPSCDWKDLTHGKDWTCLCL